MSAAVQLDWRQVAAAVVNEVDEQRHVRSVLKNEDLIRRE